MSRFGFVGPSYTLQSVNADCQECINWYVENDESGDGKSARILLPTPGLSPFANVPGAAQVRQNFTINGRTFAMIDANLYEVPQAGGVLGAPLGAIGNDGARGSMAASPQQLAVVSAGGLYIFQLQTQVGISQGSGIAGTFVQVPVGTFSGPVSSVGYSDGFFVVLVAGSERFYVSQSFDATNWVVNGSKIISTYADNTVSMIVDHRELWLLGAKASETEYDSGNLFPFDTNPSGFLEEGCGAGDATVQLDNSVFWIGARNDQGGGIAWRAQGYTPVRVSTHAVETAWQSYPTFTDARAFTYQEGGHKFWHITFPSANVTWVYDVATGLWHKRGYWNKVGGVYQAALPQCHTYNFGKHLVGDRSSGTIYQMSLPVAKGGGWNFVTDNGNTIRRLRRAPHVSTENEWMKHASLWIDVESGVGPQPPLRDGAGNPRDPMLTLRYSDDGGHTWSNGRDLGFGQAGAYRTRAKWNQLGRSRDRVYEVTCSDPVPVRIVDAYLQAKGRASKFETQERLSKQLSKVA